MKLVVAAVEGERLLGQDPPGVVPGIFGRGARFELCAGKIEAGGDVAERDVFLGGEDPEERRAVVVGGLGDLIDGRRLKPLLQEQRERSTRQIQTRLLLLALTT